MDTLEIRPCEPLTSRWGCMSTCDCHQVRQGRPASFASGIDERPDGANTVSWSRSLRRGIVPVGLSWPVDISALRAGRQYSPFPWRRPPDVAKWVSLQPLGYARRHFAPWTFAERACQ